MLQATCDRYGSAPSTIKAKGASYRGVSTSPDRFCYSPRSGQATAKLDHVSGKFSGLYSDLESEKQHKRLSEHERYTLLKDKLDSLEGGLQAEAAKRHDADKALQAHIDVELHKLSERLAGQLKEVQLSIKGGLDQLNRSVRELNTALVEEREQRRVDVDHVGTSLCTRLDEVVQTLDEERFSRLEQERQSLKRIGEDLYKTNERIDCEKQCREAALGDLASELHGFVGSRAMQDEQFNQRVMEEVATLRHKLGAETADRIHEDEAIVNAINEYTRALQDGLRIVGSN